MKLEIFSQSEQARIHITTFVAVPRKLIAQINKGNTIVHFKVLCYLLLLQIILCNKYLNIGEVEITLHEETSIVGY